MQAKRNRTIDIIKGIGILFVILGHMSLIPDPILIWIYSFHMPLFFLTSGWLFSIDRYPSFGSFFQARVKTIVIPYFCLGFATWLLKNCFNTGLYFFLNGPEVDWDVKRIVLSLILAQRFHKYYFSLWFLCVLFLGELIFYAIVRLAKEKTAAYLGLAVFFLLLQWLVSKNIVGGYWSFDLVPACVAFLSLGYAFRRICDKRFFRLWLFPFVFSGSVIICAFIYVQIGRIDLFASTIGNPIYYGLAAILGTWSVAIFAVNIETHKILEYLGRNSLIVYIFQNLFSIPVAQKLTNWISRQNVLFQNETFQLLVALVLTLIISAVLVDIIRRFFPWMLGRKKIS